MTKGKKHTQKQTSHRIRIQKKGCHRDKLHQRTKEGILEGMIRELNHKSYQQFSNLKKRNISQAKGIMCTKSQKQETAS